MLSMIRSELFRIVRSRFLIAYVIVFFLFAFATPFALWLSKVWPAFAATGIVVVPDAPLPSLQLYGVSFVGGSFLAIGAGVAMGYFAALDLKSGFAKNLVQAQGGRIAYAVALIVCSVVLAVVTTAVGMLIVEATLRLQGYDPAAPSAEEALQWFAQVALCVSAYASMAVLVAVATKSETAAVFAAIFLGGGTVESLAQLVLANIPGIPAALRDCLDGYLAVDLATLGQGAVCDPMTYVQAGATILVVGGLAALVMRRRALA